MGKCGNSFLICNTYTLPMTLIDDTLSLKPTDPRFDTSEVSSRDAPPKLTSWYMIIWFVKKETKHKWFLKTLNAAIFNCFPVWSLKVRPFPSLLHSSYCKVIAAFYCGVKQTFSLTWNGLLYLKPQHTL